MKAVLLHHQFPAILSQNACLAFLYIYIFSPPLACTIKQYIFSFQKWLQPQYPHPSPLSSSSSSWVFLGTPVRPVRHLLATQKMQRRVTCRFAGFRCQYQKEWRTLLEGWRCKRRLACWWTMLRRCRGWGSKAMNGGRRLFMGSQMWVPELGLVGTSLGPLASLRLSPPLLLSMHPCGKQSDGWDFFVFVFFLNEN